LLNVDYKFFAVYLFAQKRKQNLLSLIGQVALSIAYDTVNPFLPVFHLNVGLGDIAKTRRLLCINIMLHIFQRIKQLNGVYEATH